MSKQKRSKQPNFFFNSGEGYQSEPRDLIASLQFPFKGIPLKCCGSWGTDTVPVLHCPHVLGSLPKEWLEWAAKDVAPLAPHSPKKVDRGISFERVVRKDALLGGL